MAFGADCNTSRSMVYCADSASKVAAKIVRPLPHLRLRPPRYARSLSGMRGDSTAEWTQIRGHRSEIRLISDFENAATAPGRKRSAGPGPPARESLPRERTRG